MSNTLNARQVGLTLGKFVALIHVVWSVLVAAGLAQGLVDWIFHVHMIRPFIIVTPFLWPSAILLVAATFAVGYAVGYVFVSIWNMVQAWNEKKNK